MLEYLGSRKTETQINRKTQKGEVVTEMIDVVDKLQLAVLEVSLQTPSDSRRPALTWSLSSIRIDLSNFSSTSSNPRSCHSDLLFLPNKIFRSTTT